MSDWLHEDTLHDDQLIRPMVNLYRISAGPPPVAFVRQKQMAIKEDIRFFADESETRELFRIKARSMFDLGGRYDVTSPEGETIGVLGKVSGSRCCARRGRSWTPTSRSSRSRRSAPPIAILRRVIDSVPYGGFVPIPYNFTFDAADASAILTAGWAPRQVPPRPHR